MSALKNLGFGTRTPAAYTPSADMYSMMGGGGVAAGADAAYAPSGYSPDAGMYDMMGAGGGGLMDDPEDIKQKIADWLKKKGKKGDGQGQGQGLLDVYQGMRPVSPFSIIGRPNLQGR
jgi:hypothetical protein